MEEAGPQESPRETGRGRLVGAREQEINVVSEDDTGQDLSL